MEQEQNDSDLLASAERLLQQSAETGLGVGAIADGSLDSATDSAWFSGFLGSLIEPSITAEALLGRVVGTVEILRVVGEGGMGVVYEGWDRRLQRRVALKRLTDFGETDARRRAGLLTEARALSRLDHPGICRVLDLVEDECGDLLVMEFIEGKSLRQVINEGASTSARTRIAAEIAAALVAAHASGVVHRDLKPENILVQTDGSAKVLDFGIAKLAESTAQEPSRAPDLPAAGPEPVRSLEMGTPFYMSPEQARGLEVGPATDAWSFGVVLRELFPDGATGESDLPRLIDDLTREAPQDRCSMAAAQQRLETIQSLPQRRRRRRIALLSLVAALFVGVLLSTAILRYRASEEAQWREEWEEEVAWVRQMKRHAFTQPLHDVRSELAMIAERSERLEQAVAAAPRMARRSGRAALGRIELEIGDAESARVYLESAVDAGERGIATTRALGEALGALYVGELRQVDDLSSPLQRQQRLENARTELLEPAVGWLQLASRGDPDPASLTLARLAFLEKRYVEALELTDQVAEENPWSFDAHLLAGAIHHARGREWLRDGDAAKAVTELAAAALRVQQAIGVAPSHPASLGEACNLASHRVALLSHGLEGSFDELFAVAIDRCSLVLDANPDLSYYNARLAHIRLRRAQRTFYSGGDPSADIELARERATRAIDAEPTGFALSQRAWGYLLSVLSDRAHGRDATENLALMSRDFELAKRLEPGLTSTYSSALWGASVQAEYERDFGGDPTATVESAHQDYLTTRKLNPYDTVVHLNMGWCWVVLAQHQVRSGVDPTHAVEMAFEVFANDQENRQTNPNLSGNIGEAHLVMAEFELLQGRSPAESLAAARVATSASIALDDKIFWTHLDLAYADLLQAEWLLRQRYGAAAPEMSLRDILDRAESHAQAALVVYPEWPFSHKALGQIDFLLAVERYLTARDYSGQIAKARRHFDDALELDPGFSEAFARRGVLRALETANFAGSSNEDIDRALAINRNLAHLIDQQLRWLAAGSSRTMPSPG
jgi:serine/threonine-protein kinase